METPVQTLIVFGIVAAAAGYLLHGSYRKYAAGPLANFFLKRGKVGLAMRIRGGKSKSLKDCGKDCGCD